MQQASRKTPKEKELLPAEQSLVSKVMTDHQQRVRRLINLHVLEQPRCEPNGVVRLLFLKLLCSGSTEDGPP